MALLQFLPQRVALTPALFILIIAASIFAVIRYKRNSKTIPISVNYFFSRKCNKTCGFCFHTAKTSYILPEKEAKRGLHLLREAGMQKINFAGGEPFLYPKFLSKMLQYCKEDLQLESVSIVTNGSKVTERFLKQYGQYIDVLAVSCDSFNEQTNIAIGRGDGDNVTQLFKIRDWCRAFNIKFKLNTVVNRLNFKEDMVTNIEKLQPFRWKAFQVLMVKGENDSEATLTDVRKFEIEDAEYKLFCDKHRHIPFFIPEDNKVMASSYLLLDEYLRFLDKGEGRMKESESLLDVGVERALKQVRWDQKSFFDRGGVYDWSKELGIGEEKGGGGCGADEETKKKLEW
jgi:radical S-adenosyl methionine domain-containing protein 2